MRKSAHADTKGGSARSTGLKGDVGADGRGQCGVLEGRCGHGHRHGCGCRHSGWGWGWGLGAGGWGWGGPGKGGESGGSGEQGRLGAEGVSEGGVCFTSEGSQQGKARAVALWRRMQHGRVSLVDGDWTDL